MSSLYLLLMYVSVFLLLYIIIIKIGLNRESYVSYNFESEKNNP